MTARDSIATAASTVAGIKCAPFITGSTDPGSAFVHLDSVDWPNKFGAVNTWHVVIVLPQDIADAERFIEAHAALLFTALRHELAVESLTLQELSIPSVGTLPTAIITGTREA